MRPATPMTQLRIDTLQELQKSVGQEVAVTGYRIISQEQVNLFADVTGDRQWIHVDVERAARESPYKGTIAHGFLTVSMISDFLREAVSFARPLGMAVNYGLDRVRFPQAVRTGSRIRNRAVLKKIEKRGFRKVLVTVENTIEVEGAAKPAMVADVLVLIYL
jgi:acyl dehydratase